MQGRMVFRMNKAVDKVELRTIAHGGIQAVFLEDVPILWAHEVYGI